MTINMENLLARRSSEAALAFGSLIRRRRNNHDAPGSAHLASGWAGDFSIRFGIWKTLAHSDEACLVAQALGLNLVDLLASRMASGYHDCSDCLTLQKSWKAGSAHSARIL